jgi:phosphatidylserine/phosphatidylglycerophosphate/cardiolipin synthase-like enzyme
VNNRLHILVLLIIAVCPTLFGGCNMIEGEPNIAETPRVQVFFNHTGSRQDNKRDIRADEFLVDRINAAEGTIDAATYGFSNRNILDALVAAHLRGVRVRVAGDARHFGYNERGYRIMQQHHIPMQVGNEWHIMHNKFFVIDDYYVFVGTGNITTTGFERNDNNWTLIESPFVAADFKAEFEQMFNGKFSVAKERLDNGNTYQVGDTVVEVYFSPQEDAMGRILEELEKVDTNIYFTIFAFTKDQIGSAFINKHREFLDQLTEEEKALPVFSPDPNVRTRPKVVTGILDRSQVQGNYLYHEVYRLMKSGVPMMMDANENSYLPGDYQAGGGRLHSKTMILDRGTPNARVVTGSFNWSSAATIANDEVLLILRGEEITEQYYTAYKELWTTSKSAETAMCNYMQGYAETGLPLCANDVEPGDIIISEVHWMGWNGLTDQNDRTGRFRDELTDDEFIELYNTTDLPINLSLWTFSNGSDFKMGFTPGTVIQPGEYFLVLDHNIEQYNDTLQLEGETAFINPDFVVNTANDPRFPRLNIKDSNMNLFLQDPFGRVMDRAGDGGLPFFGGAITAPDGNVNDIVGTVSMERVINGTSYGPGNERSSWKAYSLDKGGANVNPNFRDIILASPGEPNSP